MYQSKVFIKKIFKYFLIINFFIISLQSLGQAGDGSQKSNIVIEGWKIIDDGNVDAPSSWFVSDGVFIQSSNINDGSNDRIAPEKQGTYALNGKDDWTDYTVSVSMMSKDNDAIGLMFRYIDKENYYRFSMDSQRHYRRIIKKMDGKVTVLAEDSFSYLQNTWYKVKAKVVNDNIKIFINEKQIFSVVDSGGLSQGKIGLYCWGNSGSEFKDLLMTVLEGWSIVDEGDKDGPSSWYVSDGILIQSSNIYGGSEDVNDPAKPGTYVLNGELSWTDYVMNVSIRSKDNDSIGIMFRYKDKDNYYRFSMDSQRNSRMVIKKINGKISILAEDKVPYVQNQWYLLKAKIIKDKIKIYIDDKIIFDISDNSLSQGKVGLYSWGNTGSEYKDLVVTPFKAVFEDQKGADQEAIKK